MKIKEMQYEELECGHIIRGRNIPIAIGIPKTRCKQCRTGKIIYEYVDYY